MGDRMGTRSKQGADDVSEAEVEELLDTPETAEEKAALDSVVSDLEEILKRARRRMEQPKL